MPDLADKPLLDAAARTKIARANLANILKKLQAGKTLTRTDRETLDASSKDSPAADARADLSKFSLQELADYWRVKVRTISRWKLMAPPGPMRDVAAMVEWSAGQYKLSTACRKRIDELRNALGVSPLEKKNVDWEQSQAKSPAKDNPDAALAAILRARDFAAWKFEQAARNNVRPDMKFYADLLSQFEGVIHDAQLRARKLGIDDGELLPRPEVERVVWALAYWLLRSTDQHLDALTSALTVIAPGLEGEAVRRVLESELLSNRFLVPFAKAARVQGGVTLPTWLVAKMREATGDFLKKGSERFDEVKP